MTMLLNLAHDSLFLPTRDPRIELDEDFEAEEEALLNQADDQLDLLKDERD